MFARRNRRNRRQDLKAVATQYLDKSGIEKKLDVSQWSQSTDSRPSEATESEAEFVRQGSEPNVNPAE